MPTYKVDYFFETDVGPGAGWVETYYCTSDSAIADFLPQVAALTFIAKRCALMHREYQLMACRVSDTAILRDSLVNFYRPPQGIGTFPAPSEVPGSEVPWNSVLVRGEAGALKRRAIHLRGLPKGIISDTFAYNPDPLWGPRFDAWGLSLFVPPAFQIRTVTFGPQAVSVLVGLNALSRGLLITFAVALPAGFTVGAFIKVSGMTGATNVNRVWRIAAVNGLQVITGNVRKPIIGEPASFAVCQLQTANYVNLTAVQAERGAVKKTGRPFDLLRGKLAARAA